MEGAANTATLDEEAQHFRYSNYSTVRSSSPCPSAGPTIGQASDAWRRPRSVSTVSSLESSSADQPVSCVSRETANGDCATQRFIIWAAIRRNECRRMTEEERLECPLLRCTRRFSDHESMLRHLVACDFLPSCEYWCYDHMRIERFDDSRCQKGLGHSSSKRRKMFSVAKKFISSLGHHGAGRAAGDSDSLVSPSSASISDPNADDMPYASASLVSLFSLNRSSSVSRTFRKGSSSSGRRTGLTSNPNSGQSGSRRSLGQRSSASVADSKRHSHSTHHAPLTRSKAAVCAELPSTEIVELDSKEIYAVPKSALLSPSSPHARSFASPADPSGTVSTELYRNMPSAAPSMVAFSDPVPNEAPILSPTSSASNSSPVSPLSFCPTPPGTTGAGFSTEPSTVNPVQLVLSDIDSNTSIASLSSPASPLPFCPSPPMPTSADFATKPSTIDPVQLVLSDNDATNDFQQSLMEWELSKTTATPLNGMPSVTLASTIPLYIPVGAGLPHQAGSSSSRPPRPASTTSPRSKNLSPSSSVRSTTSTWSNLTTTSTMTAATTISNVSDVSDVGALSGTGCASTTTSGFPLPSEGSEGDQMYLPWLPIDQTSATTTVDAIGDVEYSNFFNDLYSDDDRAVSESTCCPNPSPADYVPPSGGMEMDGVLLNSSLFVQDPSAFVQTAVQASEAECSVMEPQDENGNGNSSGAPNKTARSIQDVDQVAARTWGSLSNHVTTSLLKLRSFNTTGNTLAARLRDATPKQIVDVAFTALQQVLLSRSTAVSPFDMLCLLHLVHAFSSVTHEAEAVLRSDELFSQTLAYSAHYASPDRENYLQVASLLWQHGEPTSVPTTGKTAIGEHDAIASSAKTFLDDLEIAAILGRTPLQAVTTLNSSDLVLRHSYQQDVCQATAFVSSVNDVLRTLSHDYAKDSLVSAFRDIGQKAACGALPNVRRLEIELIKVGKEHLGSSASLNEFVRRARALCDVVYAKNASAAMQRSVFYNAGLSLLRQLFAAKEDSPLSPTDTAASSVAPADTWMLNDVPADFGLCSNNGIGQGVHPLSKAESATAVLAPADTQGPKPGKSKGPPPQPSTSKSISATKKKAAVAVGEKCTLCNYRPKGDPEWFQGSMAKHMMTKHSEAEVYYECSFPGCKSRYRNREDNLRQHEKKVHGLGDGKKRPVQDLAGGSEVESGGAAKRRKVA